MDRSFLSSMPLLMSFKISAREVNRLLDRLEIAPSGNLDLIDVDSLHVAAVQLQRRQYASLAEYVEDMNRYVSDAINHRAQLICFPSYSGVLPASFLPQSEALLAKLRPPDTGLPSFDLLHDCLSYYADFMYEAYYNTMSGLAARHGVYIMAGTTFCFEGHDLRHRAFLFGEGGDLLGFQDKASLNALEAGIQTQPANEIKVFETPWGGMAILSGEDADYYEIARIARNSGARLLLHPTVYPREYTAIDAAAGLNLRVQENNLFGVQSVMVGDSGLGFTLEGKSCIYAPNTVSAGKNGVVNQSSGHFEPDLLCMRLDMEQAERRPNPVAGDVNRAFLERYVDRLV